LISDGSVELRISANDEQIALLRCAAGEMNHLNQLAILRSLLVGLSATLGTMVLHGLAVHTIIMKMRRDLKLGRLGIRLPGNLTFVSSTMLLLLAGHILEIALWAYVLNLCGAGGDFREALYCSAGSYTTVGSGDVVLSPPWRLLGPFEAATGMLMFGVSTALIFAVIQRLIHARLDGAEHN
jgi:Ion channel